MCDYDANDLSGLDDKDQEYCMSGDNMAQIPGVEEEEEGEFSEEEEIDIYVQLEQKQKDLTLAAELGKALLEKNEELERRNEQLVEDFAQKIEVSSTYY
jgi:coiled-coil domain-containing protein 64